MLIYLVRHGIAVEREDWAGEEDRRPLTPEGRARLRLIGAGLRRLGIEPAALWSSPLTRAEETARILQDEMELIRIDFTDRLRPEADPAALPPFLHELPADTASVMLVGHDPHMSRSFSYLLSGGDTVAIDYKKGGVACLEAHSPITPGGCVLRWYATPKLLAALGEAEG